MEDLVVIEEMLAKKMIDAGMSCVEIKYAVPKKIADLFKVIEQPQLQNATKPKKRKKGPPVRYFKVSIWARKHLKRMQSGSANYEAAKIIVDNFPANTVIPKSAIKAIWSDFGFADKFIAYGSGQMLTAGILIATDEDGK